VIEDMRDFMSRLELVDPESLDVDRDIGEVIDFIEATIYDYEAMR
jgi:uncharacterized protein (UPF0335 family)